MKKIITVFFTILFAVILSVAAFAAPITDMPTVITQPDGTEINCLASGDEYFNFLHDENGYVIKKADDGWYEYCFGNDDGIVTSGVRVGNVIPQNALTKETVYEYARKIIDEALAMYEATSVNADGPENEIQNASYFSGTFNNIVIFICFKGEDTTVPKYIRDNLPKLYNTGYSPSTSLVPEVSVKDYFKTLTNGKIDINTTFYPSKNGTVYFYEAKNARECYMPYNASTNPNGYQDRTAMEHSLLKDAIDSIKSQIPSTLNVDANNDGYVDSITFIVKGGTTEWNTLLWSHKWNLSTNYKTTINGKTVNAYSFDIQNSVYIDNSSFNPTNILHEFIYMGTICHEMLHTFNFPDMYDYYTNPSAYPIGNYEVMASNNELPQFPTVYTRETWGIYDSGKSWVDGQVKTVTTGVKQTFTLKASASNSGTIALKIPYSLTGYTSSAYAHSGISRTVYIEYRGICGKYECERTSVGSLFKINSIIGTNYRGTGFDWGTTTGLLVYETGNSTSNGNTRRGCSSCSTPTKDCYTLWAYRENGSIYTQPTAFKENTGDVCISLTNGTIIKISNIDEANDKSEVTFDIEIFVNGDPTCGKTTDGFYITEGVTASTLLTSLTTQYISWNSGNCNYYNGTPSTNTQLTTTILDKNGQTVSGSTVIGTGYTIKVTSANARLVRSIETVVYGDIDGNAKTDVNDMILLKKHLSSENGTLKGASLYAADKDKSSDVTVIDLRAFAAEILTSTKK